MPIEGRQAQDCFNQFRDHIAQLVAATLTSTAPVHCDVSGDVATLSFRRGRPLTTVPLQTEYGVLHFYLGQSLRAKKLGRKKYQLTTEEYWYRLQEQPGQQERAFLRWEYKSQLVSTGPHYCRHHVQMRSDLQVSQSRVLDLDRLHVPTGWVTIEEVIRFLISDLGVDPPCGDRWPETLAESERIFFEEFSSKRY